MLSLVLAALLLALPGPISAVDKKAAYLADKRTPAPRLPCTDDPRCRPPLRAGTDAKTVLYARHLHTLEVMPLRDAPPALVRRFFRCRFTESAADHPENLLAGLIAAADHFKAPQIHIISGFRHPKFNLMLTKKGREVARDSQHTRSQAIDFSLPDVDASVLYKYARKRWKGGVGYYPVSHFIHLDTGKRRTWRGT